MAQKNSPYSHESFEQIDFKRFVIGLPKLKFEKDHICEACQKGKQIKNSFKLKNVVLSSKPPELLYMDLFGP